MATNAGQQLAGVQAGLTELRNRLLFVFFALLVYRIWTVLLVSTGLTREGSVVGGNVWLTESVPPYSQVTMESPKLVVHRGEKPELGAGI